ncbi:hypothetical protein MKW98_013910 [Papaver atlanticum]|uniref:Uncharacterized protein n=1 Tax=Papaver atlanticum TaxID=357466 RepID=A0AAD4SDC7_9MAGN|nr:hypothetical protein MKW98_013910 [Papaver atlanticum]
MGKSSEKTRAKKGISSEVTRERKANEHQDHELEKETKDDPNVKVCKRKRYTEVLGKEQRDKCQNCVQPNREIDGLKYEIEGLKNEFLELEVRGDLVKVRCNQLKTKILDKETSEREKALEKECVQLNGEVKDLKLGKKRDAVEIEDLKVKCTEMGIQETVLLNHEIELGKKLEAYKIKCQGLSAELERKEMELENQLVVVTNGFDQERESYRTRCIGMEEKIKGLIEEGIVVFDREMSAQERICHLEEVIKKMEAKERERLAELEAYNFKFQGLSAELEQKEMELETLRGLDREREDYMTKCIGMEEQIKGLIEEGIVLTEGEECRGKNLSLGGGNLAHVNSQCKSAAGGKDYFASAVGRQGQLGFETQEGTLTRFRKCSGTPSSENLALVRQEDGARPSTTSCILEIVEIDSEEEIVDISDNEEEN